MTSQIFLSVSGALSKIDQEDIESHFSKKKYGGGHVQVLKFDNDKILVSITNLDDDGTVLYIASTV